VRDKKGEKYPPGVAKYNVSGWDLLGIELQQVSFGPQMTPSIVYRCQAPEELIDFIDTNGGMKEPFIMTSSCN
jgi:hypothetical protein